MCPRCRRSTFRGIFRGEMRRRLPEIEIFHQAKAPRFSPKNFWFWEKNFLRKLPKSLFRGTFRGELHKTAKFHIIFLYFRKLQSFYRLIILFFPNLISKNSFLRYFSAHQQSLPQYQAYGLLYLPIYWKAWPPQLALHLPLMQVSS